MIRRSGQSTMEYAVLIAVVVAALLAMQVYMKRGVAGRLRAAADSIGEPYSPRHTTSTFFLNQQSATKTESTLEVGSSPSVTDTLITKTTIQQETTDRIGTETVGPLGSDLWSD